MQFWNRGEDTGGLEGAIVSVSFGGQYSPQDTEGPATTYPGEVVDD